MPKVHRKEHFWQNLLVLRTKVFAFHTLVFRDMFVHCRWEVHKIAYCVLSTWGYSSCVTLVGCSERSMVAFVPGTVHWARPRREHSVGWKLIFVVKLQNLNTLEHRKEDILLSAMTFLITSIISYFRQLCLKVDSARGKEGMRSVCGHKVAISALYFYMFYMF